jgi:hypothetical protein
MLNNIDAELLRCAIELRLRLHIVMSDGDWGCATFDGTCGICSNLDALADTKIVQYGFEAELQDIVEQWPRYSGHRAYPVPSTDDEAPPNHIYHMVDRYDRWLGGDYAELRRDLLDFIIKTLEDKNAEI